MLKKWALRFSVLLNLLVVIGAIALWMNTSNLLRAFLEQNYERKVSFFASYPVQPGDIVFLGDSITDGGEWAEIFPGRAIKNRGIGGDTTTGVLERLQQVTDGQPAALFLKIGTNDLTHGPEERETSYRQYEDIVTRVQEASPGTRIYLQSLLPRAEGYRDDVEAFNERIQEVAQETGTTYIDLYTAFLDADGSIADAYSNDELHLNGEGYQLWQSLIKSYLTSSTEAGGS